MPNTTPRTRRKTTPEPALQLLTVDQVAARLQVDRSTVRRWIIDGRLPATKPGHGYRIDPADLDELLTVSRPLTIDHRRAGNDGRQHSQGLAS